MKTLVIGSGGREHALIRALRRDPAVTDLHCAPGNPGTARLADNHVIDPLDPVAIVELARRLDVRLVVIGPEAPLVAGAGDRLRAAGIACFGPDAAAARIEGSKAFAKQVMADAGVPTARARVCESAAEVELALGEFGPPHVVKEDGLAGGKGVMVTSDPAEALRHAEGCRRVVVEEYLDGPEASLFALCDGTAVVPLRPAQDFKRLGDGGTGPNTGGMGAYSPLSWAPADLVDEVVDRVVQPTVDELRRRGTPYTGLLYAGLALTSDGVQVVEFNARFGDPETQVVLDRLDMPLGGLLEAAALGGLGVVGAPRYLPGAAVTVVLAAPGYPQAVEKGAEITGLDAAERVPGAYPLHAGTTTGADGIVTVSGGRVVDVVGYGASVAAAREHAYAAVGEIAWPGMQYRTDIAVDPA